MQALTRSNQDRLYRMIAILLLVLMGLRILAACDGPDSDDFREAFITLAQ